MTLFTSTMTDPHYVGPENIHTLSPPHRRDWKFQKGGEGEP